MKSLRRLKTKTFVETVEITTQVGILGIDHDLPHLDVDAAEREGHDRDLDRMSEGEGDLVVGHPAIDVPVDETTR